MADIFNPVDLVTGLPNDIGAGIVDNILGADTGVTYRYIVTVSNFGSKSSRSEKIIDAAVSFAQEFSSVIFPQKTIKTRRVPNLGPSERQVITGVSYSDLTLKRGIVRENSLAKWYEQAIESITEGTSNAQWRNTVIQVLDHRNLPLATYRALIRPRMYHVTSLNAQREDVVFETLQCAVHSFDRI